jgi:hypothetical protein
MLYIVLTLGFCIANFTYAASVQNDIQALENLEYVKGILDSILSVLPSGQDILNLITHPTTIQIVTSLVPVLLGKREIGNLLPDIIIKVLKNIQNFIDGIMTVIAWIIYGPLGK